MVADGGDRPLKAVIEEIRPDGTIVLSRFWPRPNGRRPPADAPPEDARSAEQRTWPVCAAF
jgi:hypothetical protein